MIGTTLNEIHARIEEFASETGEYYLTCARYGDRPVPASNLWFDSRATARVAARATEQYRDALRGYDPRLPHYDIVVSQETQPLVATDDRNDRRPMGDSDPEGWTLTEPVLDSASARRGAGTPVSPGHRGRIEFCHRVAATVFEALSNAGYDGVETSVMDAYFHLAESVPDPDELCLCLLEAMAAELNEALAPDEQAEVLAGAAARLDPAEPDENPVVATLERLEDRKILEGYTRPRQGRDVDGGARGVVVHVEGYALSPREGRLPVLPVVVELARRRLDRSPPPLRVADAGREWEIEFREAGDSAPDGLVSVPIQRA
jgi:hypothetical protein